MEVIKIGNIYGFTGGSFAGAVYSSQGLSPSINSMEGGNRQPMILENMFDFYNKKLRDDKCSGTITTHSDFTGSGVMGVIEKVKIKQATKKGYTECKVGGVADLSYPSSKTRRGRVQDGGDVSPGLTVSGMDGLRKIESLYRIRKLTPIECWRLMGFTDEEFNKAAEVNCKTQLFKQAGNSIVVDVLVGIFKQIFEPADIKGQLTIFDIKD